MAGVTKEIAQAKLDALLAAYDKVLLGQEVTIDGQTLKRANLDQIQKGIEYWDAQVKTLTAVANGRPRSRLVAPRW